MRFRVPVVRTPPPPWPGRHAAELIQRNAELKRSWAIATTDGGPPEAPHKRAGGALGGGINTALGIAHHLVMCTTGVEHEEPELARRAMHKWAEAALQARSAPL